MLGLRHLALRQTFNRCLTLTVVLIAISQMNYGFDMAGFAATQAMDSFDKQFGYFDEEKNKWTLSSTWLSLFNSLTYLGFILGVIIGSWVSKRYGRRMCMFSMSIWVLVANVIVITATEPEQMLVGRILFYIYIGMELVVVPIFQSEITPKHARGFIVGTFTLSSMFGILLMYIVCRGTGFMEGAAAYRIPYGLFFVTPTFVASVIWLVPESPRWLALQERPEEALHALRRLRQGKYSEDQIQEELDTIIYNIKYVEHEKGNFKEMFQGGNLKRTLICCAVNFFYPASGQVFLGSYSSIYIKSLGVVDPFTFKSICYSINLPIIFGAMLLTDYIGRRKVTLLGLSVQAVGLMVMGGLGTLKPYSYGVKWGIVIAYAVSVTALHCGWGLVFHILTAEIPKTKLRDLTYRLASVVQLITQLAFSLALPYILFDPVNLGPEMGLVWGSIAVAAWIYAFYHIPECAGRSLEEVDALFDSKVPVRHFHKTPVSVGRAVSETSEKSGVSVTEGELVKRGSQSKDEEKS